MQPRGGSSSSSPSQGGGAVESSSASSAKKKSSHSLGSGKPRSGDVVAVHPPSLSSNKSQRRRGRTASTRIIGTTIGYIGNTATHIERGELPSRSAPSAIDHATRRGDTWCECRCRIRCTRINSGLRTYRIWNWKNPVSILLDSRSVPSSEWATTAWNVG